MSFFSPQNPGIGGLNELTNSEEIFLTSLAGLSLTNGDILYASGGFLTNLGIGTAGQVLTVSGGYPSWATGGGGGGGHTIEDEGTPLTQRTNLNFVGAGVTVTDAGGKTVVTIPGGGTVGPGTVNEIAYFDTTTSIASLSVATYPSLTQLSYVKGVTSAIQTQLDAKQPLDSDLTTIAGLTATTDNFMQAKASAWASRTPAQVKVDLNLAGSNTGDQTSIVGITGTKAQFNTAVTDGDILYVGDITQYIDEMAQDAIGVMIDSSLTYVDATPLLQRSALTGAITATAGSNATSLGSFTSAQLAGALTDETGTGANVFGTSPNLLGTPSIQPTSPINNPPYSIVSDRPTTNLIINPSFEVNVTNGWFQKGTATITRDTTDKFIGDASMKIVTSAVDSGVTSSLMTISPSTRHVLSFWVKGAVGGESLEAIISASLGTATMTIASPCVVTRVAHGLAANTSIYFTTTGALPTGITAYTAYYVISTGLTADAFRFAATVGGAAINTSGTQSGTHTLFSNDRATKDGFLIGMTTVPSTTWKRMRWFYTSGAGVSAATVSLNSITAGAQTLYIDGVQFEQQTLPTGSTDSPFASAYCDGSLGNGHSWSGTAHNSTSSRVAGVHSLAPLSSTSAGGFIQRPDGSLGGKFTFEAQEAVFGTPAIVTADEPYFPFQVKGNFATNTLSSGSSQGVALFENKGNGAALFVQSSASTSLGVVYDFDSLTTGSGVAVYAPESLSALYSGGGALLKFAGKTANNSLLAVTIAGTTFGDTALFYEKRLTIWNGGGMSATETSVLTGTVSTTAASAIVTGTGTTFIANYKRGDRFEWQWDGAAWAVRYVLSVESDLSMTLSAVAGVTTAAPRAHKSRTRQYNTSVIQMEGIYGDHRGGTTDFLYGIYPSGGNGQLRVLKSATVGSLTMPTADNVGSSVVLGRASRPTSVSFTSASETTVIDGYTIPAWELQTGNAIRIKFFGNMDTILGTSTVTWRVKLGGTTILTSTARQSGSLNNIDFAGEITIVGTSLSTQKVALDINGADTTLVTGVNVYNEQRIGTSTIVMSTDRTLTVTAQFSDASTMSLGYASIVLEQ